MYVYFKVKVMNQNLKDKIVALDLKDSFLFKEMEENILKYGLQGFKNKASKSYHQLYNLILKRNPYSESILNHYLNSLDTAYEIRTQFCEHMHSQNTCSVLYEDNRVKDLEITRLENVLESRKGGLKWPIPIIS